MRIGYIFYLSVSTLLLRENFSIKLYVFVVDDVCCCFSKYILSQPDKNHTLYHIILFSSHVNVMNIDIGNIHINTLKLVISFCKIANDCCHRCLKMCINILITLNFAGV